MSKNLLDVNIILRFLVNDDPKKADKVKKILQGSKPKNILPDVVLAEIVWVLSSYYGQPKSSVIEKMRALIHLDSIECNLALLDSTFTFWEYHNISFIDAYLLAKSQLEDLTLYSYDKKLTKISGVNVQEP